MAALGEAYDLYHASVRAFARRLLGDAATAEDLVQETFLALPKALGSYRGEATLRSFVIGVAANHARHHVRSVSRLRKAHERAADEHRPSPLTPEERTEVHELAEALRAALDELPFEQRVAIVLCEVEERPSHEAAFIAGVPEGTLRSRLRLAREKLRSLLTAEGFR